MKKEDVKKIWSLAIDFAALVLLVSIVNLALIKLFNFSPTGLLRQGIQTSVFEQKMQILDYLAIIYILFIVAYLVFLRRYYSLGDQILDNLNKKKK